jgi:poly-gamma-glutamate synthesis protein (capsule biosynthesis protein)
MPRTVRPQVALIACVVAVAAVAACTSGGAHRADPSSSPPSTPSTSVGPPSTPRPAPSTPRPSTPARPDGEFTFAFAGDVHFAERTAALLTNPATAFGPAAPGLRDADLAMVNLETAITTRGTPAPKDFHFRTPATALTALHDAGIDVATMANNHAADYGSVGLSDTLAAIRTSRFPIVGIGPNADAAFAPWTATVRGVKIAVMAASQVRDETLANYSAGASSPGIASADSDRLVQSVRAARTAGYTVIVYLHWGTEFTACPNGDQRGLADRLARAGATAIIGAHVHQLQGAGWRPDGAYVAYGLGNYLWWRSFNNAQDDNGVLTLAIRPARVAAARFAPAHLDDRGIPVPATGALATRINAQWAQVRGCANLAATPATR